MKYLIFLILSGSLAALAAPCDIGPAAYKAKQTKRMFLERYQGGKTWDKVEIGTCRLGWAESVIGQRRPNVSYSIECGVVFDFSTNRKAEKFAESIHSQNLSFITIFDLFADVTVPVCAEVR